MAIVRDAAYWRYRYRVHPRPRPAKGTGISPKRQSHNRLIAYEVAELLNISIPKARQILTIVLSTMKEALARYEPIQIRGFGSFHFTYPANCTYPKVHFRESRYFRYHLTDPAYRLTPTPSTM